MTTFREYADLAYQARLSAEATAEQAAKDALVASAQQALFPIFTDPAGKLVLDPTKTTAAELVDLDASLVVLSVTDGSVPFAFAVRPDRPVVIATDVDGAWTEGPEVADLDDVGEYLTTGKVG